MPEMFITFEGVNAGPCTGFYVKQAQANAAATGNADVVAHVGALEVGTLVPSEAYFNGTAVVSDDAYEVIVLADRTDLQKLKEALRAHHAFLSNVAHAIIEEGISHDIAEEHIIHNQIAFAHHGAYTVAHDDDLTHTQKITWAQNQILLPSDVTGSSLAEKAFHWFEAVRAASGIVAPMSACAWVNPSTGARIAVGSIQSSIVPFFGVDPVIVEQSDLAQGGWIESLT